jgi:hypothetical protein
MTRFVRFPTQTTNKGNALAFNAVCYRRIVVRDGVVEARTRGMQESRSISRAWIPESISKVTARYFYGLKQFHWITFESNSQLTRIESKAFSSSSLQSIVIPRNVEILGSSCFSSCKSLISISFESNSRVTRIESDAFSNSSLQSIMIPCSVEILGM